MKIFLTGATGFIGQKLTHILNKKKHQLLSVTRSSTTSECFFLSHLEELCTEPTKWSRVIDEFQPDVIIHLAWSHSQNKFRDDNLHLELNLKATQNLIDIVYSRKNIHFIGLGSQAEYGVQNKCLSPDTACMPEQKYGLAKYEAGVYALNKLGPRASWLRLLTAYGPGDHHTKLVPYLFNQFHKKQTPQLSSGTQVWDWLYVNDAAEAIAMAAERRISEKHVLCSGFNSSIKSLALQIHTLFKSEDPNTPKPIFSDHPGSGPTLLSGDNSTLRAACGWSPKIDISAGLRLIYKDFL